jgi:DNA-binding CsgD family transcriptional regulator/predicted ATPase
MRLLGRERERAHVAALLAADTRAIGISGRAGVGKSALLATVAASSPEGVDVWSVDLDGVEGAGLCEAVGRGLGWGAAQMHDGADPGSRLARLVGPGPVLLTVDHADLCAFDPVEAMDLLEACPALRLVVVRAAPWEGDGFHDLRLLPLAVPALDATPGELRDFASVQLFVETAARVDARFHPDDTTLHQVAAICRLLGGLPLAIELAAARVRVMSPADLARDLAGSAGAIDLLTAHTSGRSAGVREALASTVGSLGAGEREMLADLASFAGSVPFSAAVAVRGGSAGEVADELERLTELRLIEPVSSSLGEPVYAVLPIVRRFVGEAGMLATSSARRRDHLRRALTDAADAHAHATQPAALAYARELQRDLVVEALRRFDENPLDAAEWITSCAAVISSDAESAPLGELLERLIATHAVDQLPRAEQARVWIWSADALAFSPDGASLARLITERWERGASLVDAREEPLLCLESKLIAASLAVATGDFARAGRAAREGREVALEHAQPTWAARFEVWIAAGTHAAGDVPAAVTMALRALDHALRVADVNALAGATIVLHTVPAGSIPPDAVVPSLEDALLLARREKDASMEWLLVGALTRSGLASGKPREAAHWCAQRLAGGSRRGWSYLVAISLVHTVFIAAALGDLAFAARMLGAVSADRDRILRSMAPASAVELDRTRAMLQGRLGAAHSAAIVGAGAVLSIAEASAEALTWLRARATEPQRSPAPEPSASLTPREREVLVVLAEGLPNKVIATRLGVSTKTVMHHSVAIYRKLGVRGRAEATAYAHRHGLVTAAAW